jgi:DNA-directed RNA polymerase subunit RPC12/RpoP
MTDQQKIVCEACNTETDVKEGRCQRCGLSFPARQQGNAWDITCPRCRHVNNSGSFFCYSCGKYFADIEDGTPRRTIRKGKTAVSNGARQARVLMPGGTQIMLTGDPVFIERSDFDATLPPDLLMSISRQHILITYHKGKYYVKDYGRDGKGSTNHTSLNGVDIHNRGKKALKDGDKIELARQPELTMTFNLLPDAE